MPDTDDLTHPKTDDEILRKVVDMRSDWVSGSVNFYDRMRKSEDFVIGGDSQWEPAVLEANRGNRKFSLTIPIVKPQINQVSGSEIANPQDFIVENTREGTAAVARVLTALAKQAGDSERVKFEKSQAFRSGISSGQGVLGIFIDKTEDPRHANLRIERLVEHNVMVDPNATSYNPNKANTGAKGMIYEEWVDKEQVEAEYPDKKDELSSRGVGTFLGAVMGNISGIIDMLTGRRSSKETSSFGTRERTDVEVMTKSRYLVNHKWWREPKKCVHWFDNRQDELDSRFLCKDREIAAARKATKESEAAADIRKEFAIAAAKAQGLDRRRKEVRDKIELAGTPIFSIEEVVSFAMHHTIRVGDTFLEDRVDELNGVQMYPLIFFWPYWVNGHKSGIAEDLIGVQEEINYTHSQAMNYMKDMANPLWKVREDSTGAFKDSLVANARVPNFVIDESLGGGKVERVEQPDFPQFEIMTERAMDNVKAIGGRLDIPEKDPKALSGRAKALDIQKSQQGSMAVFLNWNYSLAIFGDVLIDIIRKNDIFTEEEIREIVDVEDLLDTEFMAQAVQEVRKQMEQLGVKLPEQPTPINPDLLQTAEPVVQQTMVNSFQEEAALFQQIQDQINQLAMPLAQGMLIDSIRTMKRGKYSTKVTVSPMAETYRMIKSAEVFALAEILLKMGDVGLDGEDLIESSDAPNKEQLKLGRQRKLAQAGVA